MHLWTESEPRHRVKKTILYSVTAAMMVMFIVVSFLKALCKQFKTYKNNFTRDAALNLTLLFKWAVMLFLSTVNGLQ